MIEGEKFWIQDKMNELAKIRLMNNRRPAKSTESERKQFYKW